MKKVVFWIAVLVVALVVGIGMRYVLNRGPSDSSESESIVGFWRLAAMSAYNPSTKQWQEGQAPEGAYQQFEADGSWCGAFSPAPESNCIQPGSYSIQDGFLKIDMTGVTGPEIRYRFNREGGRLELISETQANGEWIQVGMLVFAEEAAR